MKKIILKIFNSVFGKTNDLQIFETQFNLFQTLDRNKKLSVKKEDWYPCLNDNTPQTNFDSHYIYHPAWAARIVKKINPTKHIDISSTLHFCTILSAFIPVDFYDFRKARLSLDNLNSRKGDLMNLDLETNSVMSISCMHTIEHIGLGRYGDPIDPDGDLKALKELKRVCAKNGNLIIVVPVGLPKIAFNAHRIYDANTFSTYMDGFTLTEFALVTDQHEFIVNASLDLASSQNYGCGCYWFVKN